jgi:hypothetical protein
MELLSPTAIRWNMLNSGGQEQSEATLGKNTLPNGAKHLDEKRMTK